MPNEPKIIKAGYTGKMAICRCKKSHDLPFCDGRHRGTAVTPWKFMVTEGQEIKLCQCGSSQNMPLCDNSHEKLSGPSPTQATKKMRW